MSIKRSDVIWATAFVLCMDLALPNNIPVVKEAEEEEEENESNS